VKQVKHKNDREQMKLLETLLILLENGFSMQESLAVMKRNHQISAPLLKLFGQSLQKGQTIAESFCQIGFSAQEKAQLQLAELHGDLVVTLKTILQNRKILRKQKEELQKVGAYPLLLMVFTLALLWGMKLYLLPSLLDSGMVDESHWSIVFLDYGPILLVGFLLGSVILLETAGLYLKRQSVIRKACFISKLPVVGHLYKIYQTSNFALEWGKSYQQGLETYQILTQMARLKTTSLLTAVANELHETLLSGDNLTKQLEQYPFLLPEFSLIIFQGEIKGKLGDELLLYSQLLTERMVTKVEQLIQWLQPVIFLFVAVLIVAIYVAMFLPMYGNLGGMIE